MYHPVHFDEHTWRSIGISIGGIIQPRAVTQQVPCELTSLLGGGNVVLSEVALKCAVDAPLLLGGLIIILQCSIDAVNIRLPGSVLSIKRDL